MTDTTFSETANIIKGNIYNIKVDDLEINGLLWSYLVISSNLSNFLPELDPSEHYKIVQDIQFHKSLSGIDLHYPSLLESTKFNDDDNIVENSKNRGHIYVSYHAGSYYMMLTYLAKRCVPFCVVAGNNYINDYQELVQKVYKNIPNNDSEPLEIMSAEDPKLLLKLSRKLSQGISVFFFIDGNTGTKENNFSEDKNLLKIDFLNHHIYARQGVALLAYLTKAPIATVIATRDKELTNTVEINLLSTNNLPTEGNRNDFINSVTRKLYGKLESYLVNNYEQWTGWFYIHEFFDTDERTQSTVNQELVIGMNFVLNDSVHLVKHDDENIFLVMKTTYEIMRIGNFLFDVLTYFKTSRIITDQPLLITDEIVGLEFLKDLIEMDFLKLT